jgi:TldD protein
MSRHLWDLRAARGAPSSIAWTPSADAWYISLGAGFHKEERLFASTEGTLLTQTIILTTPNLRFPYTNGTLLLPLPTFNTPIQAGWERLSETPMIPLLEKAMDQADTEPPPPPVKQIEIGRYDIVFSAAAMAQLLNATLAPATQLDSAMGYEAYTGNVSYLGPNPLTWLGTQVASPLVNITAERSNPTGVATVRWDDEGVTPRDFPLITNGVLQNYQTTRTQAVWLAPWYAKNGQPVQSLGCAMAPTALEEPMQHTPNLVLHPGPGSVTEASLLEDLEHGLHITAIPGLLTPSPRGPSAARWLGMDWQYLHGYLTPLIATEIRHGKPVATTPLANSLAIMFTTDELWKNIQKLGGANSMEYAGGFSSDKGDPNQRTQHSIGTVPAQIKGLAVIDTARIP